MGGLFGGAPKAKDSGAFKMTAEAKAGEKELLNQLLNQIKGEGPSIANMQYEKNMQDALKSNSALMASSRGVSNAGLLGRNVANANAELTGEMAQNSALNRANEQRAAQELLGQNVASQRGVSLQAGIANSQADQAYRAQNMQLIGNMGAAGAMAFSDEELKTNKKKSGKSALRAVEEFLNSVQPYEYNYKGGDETDRLGVMAQDLEDSKIGKQMVIDTPEGKAVDYGQGFSAMMAGLAEMNKRLKTVEKKKKVA